MNTNSFYKHNISHLNIASCIVVYMCAGIATTSRHCWHWAWREKSNLKINHLYNHKESVQIGKARQAIADNLISHKIQSGLLHSEDMRGKSPCSSAVPQGDVYLSLHNYALPRFSLQIESRHASGRQQVDSESHEIEKQCTAESWEEVWPKTTKT